MSLDRVPEQPSSHVGPETDALRVAGLDDQSLARWVATFLRIFKQHKSERKMPNETNVSRKQFLAMVEFFQILVGEKGQQNYQDCLWANGQFGELLGCVSKVEDTIEASASKEDCLGALQRLRKHEAYKLYAQTKDTQERLNAPASGKSCLQAFEIACKHEAFRAEALRRMFLATMLFSE